MGAPPAPHIDELRAAFDGGERAPLHPVAEAMPSCPVQRLSAAREAIAQHLEELRIGVSPRGEVGGSGRGGSGGWGTPKSRGRQNGDELEMHPAAYLFPQPPSPRLTAHAADAH